MPYRVAWATKCPLEEMRPLVASRSERVLEVLLELAGTRGRGPARSRRPA